MKKILTTSLALFLATFTVMAASFSNAEAESVSGSASFVMKRCAKSNLLEKRQATFMATMKVRSKGYRMSTRLEMLRQEVSGGTFVTLTVPALDAWIEAKPNVRTFRVTRTFTNLSDGNYRMRAVFKWTNVKTGKVVKQMTRQTSICRQTTTVSPI